MDAAGQCPGAVYQHNGRSGERTDACTRATTCTAATAAGALGALSDDAGRTHDRPGGTTSRVSRCASPARSRRRVPSTPTALGRHAPRPRGGADWRAAGAQPAPSPPPRCTAHRGRDRRPAGQYGDELFGETGRLATERPTRWEHDPLRCPRPAGQVTTGITSGEALSTTTVPWGMKLTMRHFPTAST